MKALQDFEAGDTRRSLRAGGATGSTSCLFPYPSVRSIIYTADAVEMSVARRPFPNSAYLVS